MRRQAPQPRRIERGPRAKERVLRAALDVLAEGGLPAFSVEAVARRAGASKATVYRRWSSAGELLVDAMDWAFRPLPTPATGDLRSDLRELLSGFVTGLEASPFPRLMAAFIDAAERDPTLAARHADLTARRRRPVLDVLERARERGELPGDADLELIVDLLAGPFFYRRFIAHRPIPAGLVDDVIDRVLAGVA